MEPVVIIMVLSSAVLHALRNYFNKRALDKQAFIWWYEIFGLLFFTPIFIIMLFRVKFSISFSYLLLSGIMHFIYWYFLSKSLEKGDLSRIYPIMRSSPALVLLFSLTILKENVSVLGGIGILLVVCGVYTINMQKIGLHEFIIPIRSVFRDHATQYALLTLVSVASYTLVDKIAVSKMNPVFFAYLYPWVSLGLFTNYIRLTKTKGVLNREWTVRKKSIIICGIMGILGYFLILWAFTLERMSYIIGLRQLSIVFAVFLGGHFLNEKNKLIRAISAIIIFIGCYCITIAD
jgi:uncharacterized membrane protein